jgi:transcriptional regulator with XRE-family HTH domain
VLDARNDEWATYVRDLGIELNRHRHRVGLTQECLAHAAGLTRYHYQQLEKGQSRPHAPANPSLKTLLALAQALGVSLEVLLPCDPPDVTEGGTRR